MKSTLYEDGDLYDKTTTYYSDIDFWAKLTKGKEGILELCCGTGRITMKLLASHTDMVGIDNSKAMLTQAKLKAKEFQNKLQLYHRNITRFNLNRTFNTILLV